MISKSNKFIKYASIATLAVVAVATSLSSNNINLGKNILRGSSSDTIQGSITFSRATGTQVVISNNYYYTSGSTTNGAAVYLRNASNVSLGTNYVAVMCGNSEKGSIDPEIIFTVADSGTTQFGFQYISSISAVSNSSNSRTLNVSKSSDGSSWNNAGTMAVTSSGGSNTDVAGAKYIKLSYSGLFTLYLTSFTINYYCSASGTPDVPGEKLLTGISVKTAPTTTEYTEGDYFDPTGLVITASYNDLTTEDVTYSGNEADFSFSPSLSTALATSDDSVTISYGGESCSQNITVEESGDSFFSGTFENTSYSDYKINFDDGYYTNGSDRVYFTYNEGTNTFTLVSGTPTSFSNNWRMFNSDTAGATNTSLSKTSDTSFTIKMYGAFGQQVRTFTKT